MYHRQKPLSSVDIAVIGKLADPAGFIEGQQYLTDEPVYAGSYR